MNKQEFIKLHSELCEKMQFITERKNSDYAGSSVDDDPFANFKEVEVGKICSVEIGMLTRMSDKWSRIKSLVRSGKDPKVVDESLNDTLLDFANYCLIMIAYRESHKKCS